MIQHLIQMFCEHSDDKCFLPDCHAVTINQSSLIYLTLYNIYFEPYHWILLQSSTSSIFFVFDSKLFTQLNVCGEAQKE